MFLLFQIFLSWSKAADALPVLQASSWSMFPWLCHGYDLSISSWCRAGTVSWRRHGDDLRYPEVVPAGCDERSHGAGQCHAGSESVHAAKEFAAVMLMTLLRPWPWTATSWLFQIHRELRWPVKVTTNQKKLLDSTETISIIIIIIIVKT